MIVVVVTSIGVTEMLRNQFTAVFVRSEGWWAAYAAELPGALTQGRTLEEARNTLREAVTLVLECNRDLKDRELEGRTVIREMIEVQC